MSGESSMDNPQVEELPLADPVNKQELSWDEKAEQLFNSLRQDNDTG